MNILELEPKHLKNFTFLYTFIFLCTLYFLTWYVLCLTPFYSAQYKSSDPCNPHLLPDCTNIKICTLTSCDPHLIPSFLRKFYCSLPEYPSGWSSRMWVVRLNFPFYVSKFLSHCPRNFKYCSHKHFTVDVLCMEIEGLCRNEQVTDLTCIEWDMFSWTTKCYWWWISILLTSRSGSLKTFKVFSKIY